MALGKAATLLIGAGIVGSILTNDGGASTIRDILSGSLKVLTKHLQHERDASSSPSKSASSTLKAQIDIIRREIEQIGSSRSITIVPLSRAKSGSATGIAAVIVVGALGYLYIRWKGLKFSDLMFVTKRGLSDACTSVGKDLEKVHSDVSATERHLSSRIDRVDCRVAECNELAVATMDEVMSTRGDISTCQRDMDTVNSIVENLHKKLNQMELLQDFAMRGIYVLCQWAHSMEQGQKAEVVQIASAGHFQALESSNAPSITRALSLPAAATELPSPSTLTPVMPQVLRSSTTISASGLKELQGIINGFPRGDSPKEGSSESPSPFNASSRYATATTSSSGFSVRIPGLSAVAKSKGNNSS